MMLIPLDKKNLKSLQLGVDSSFTRDPLVIAKLTEEKLVMAPFVYRNKMTILLLKKKMLSFWSWDKKHTKVMVILLGEKIMNMHRGTSSSFLFF
jgi:hypothetical protein